MPYTPTVGPSSTATDIEVQHRYMQDQLQLISQAMEEPRPLIPFQVLHAAPGRLTDGLVAFADGSNWNPGSGAGLYEYHGGAWHKL